MFQYILDQLDNFLHLPLVDEAEATTAKPILISVHDVLRMTHQVRTQIAQSRRGIARDHSLLRHVPNVDLLMGIGDVEIAAFSLNDCDDATAQLIRVKTLRNPERCSVV